MAILVVGQVQLKGLTYALNPALFYSSDRHVAALLAMTKYCCGSDCVACPVYFCGVQPDVESLPLLRRWSAAIRDVRFSLFALLRFN